MFSRMWESGSDFRLKAQSTVIQVGKVGEDKAEKSQNRYFLANNPKQNSDCMTTIFSFSQSRLQARLPISELKNFSETDPPI